MNKFRLLQRSLMLTVLIMAFHGTSLARISACPTDNKQAMHAYIIEVLEWLNSIHGKGQPFDAQQVSRIRHYFTANFIIEHNGREVATNAKKFSQRHRLSKKFIVSNVTQLPLQNFLMDGNSAAIRMQTRIQKRRHKPEIHNVIAIIQFQDCKIASWIEVSKKKH